MQKLTLGDVVLATGGRCIQGALDMPITKICTDTRSLAAGDFFVPLVGRRYDAHDFLARAKALGASGCLVSVRWDGKGQFFRDGAGAFAIVEVADCNEAYANIAHYYRRLFFDVSVVGVTGSNGKSTTKEMIAAILSKDFSVLKNEGTLNNLIGVPRTLLNLDWGHRIAILEMGTSLPGEIAKLAWIARPDVGILTNIGPSHLEFFGDVRGVAQEKGALAERLNEKGLFVVNADDTLAWALRARTRAKVIGFGFGPEADVRAVDASCDAQGRWRFTVLVRDSYGVRQTHIALRVLGRHHIANALAAIAVAMHFGVALDVVAGALKDFSGIAMRMQPVRIGGMEFIQDAYNANPQSFLGALRCMQDIQVGGRRIVVMGDMLELGDQERQAHQDLGRHLADAGIAILICVGERARWTAEVFASTRRDAGHVHVCQDTAEAATVLKALARDGDLVLLKGSRSMHLEHVLDAMRKDEPAGVVAMRDA